MERPPSRGGKEQQNAAKLEKKKKHKTLTICNKKLFNVKEFGHFALERGRKVTDGNLQDRK